jgi:type III pantothenate kinase
VGAKQLYPMLVIDAGNTSVKFARVARRHAAPRLLATVATAQLATSRVKAIVRRSGCASATASCVVPAVRQVLRAGCPSITLIGKSTPLHFPAKVDRATVGADRLANMAEATRRFGTSVVVADFGTAATFDLLEGRGCFSGGAIAPGLRVLAKTLSEETAQLPVIELAPPSRAAGRNTREALRAGVVGGYAGMVRHLLRGLPAKHVVFTGGDAALVAKLTGLKVTIDPLWTLKGISVLGDLAAREASK